MLFQNIIGKDMLIYCNNNNSKVIMCNVTTNVMSCDLQLDFLHLLSFHCGTLTGLPLYLFFLVFHLFCSGIRFVFVSLNCLSCRSAVIRHMRVSVSCWCRRALRAVATPCALRGEPGCSSHGFCPS